MYLQYGSWELHINRLRTVAEYKVSIHFQLRLLWMWGPPDYVAFTPSIQLALPVNCFREPYGQTSNQRQKTAQVTRLLVMVF